MSKKEREIGNHVADPLTIPKEAAKKAIEFPQGDEARRAQESNEEDSPKGLTKAVRTFEEERNRSSFREVLLELDKLMRVGDKGGSQ